MRAACNHAEVGVRRLVCSIAIILCFSCLIRSAHSLQHVGIRGSIKDVKIYIYTLPPAIPRWPKNAYWEPEDWVRQSRHYTANGDEADYFWIPTFHSHRDIAAYLEVFRHIRTEYPFWNATRNRHMMTFLYDGGAGELNGECRVGDPNIPDDINPASPRRSVIFLQHNAVRDGHDGAKDKCYVCFQRGKDIMLPTPNNVCGPLCGYDLKTLQAQSMWAPANQHLHQDNAPRRHRKHLMFFAGNVANPELDDYTGRGGVFKLYKNHPDYLILNSGAPHNERTNFAEAMQNSEFCYSPRGFSGGDTDRYMAGLMFGCIPVFLSSGAFDEPMAYPYEEVIPWQLFSTTIALKDLPNLDLQLRSLLPYVTEMRRHMGHHVKQLLYSSRYGSYFGEPPDRDAMNTLMLVLQKRLIREVRQGKA